MKAVAMAAALAASSFIAASPCAAEPGDIVEDALKIGGTDGVLARAFLGVYGFGTSIGSPGDLDDNGVDDLAVGALSDSYCGLFRGAVYVLFLDGDGVPFTGLFERTRIGSFFGGFDRELSNYDYFGRALADLGDLDGDGRPELAVGAPGDDERGLNRGAVWILSLEPDGSVHHASKLGDQIGGFRGVLDGHDDFANALAALGDVDGDGITDLAVGAPSDDADRAGSFANIGAVWVLLLNADASVKDWRKIDGSPRSLGARLSNDDHFGTAVAGVGDVDGDGVADLAVGSPLDDEVGFNTGALYLLLLQADGSPKSVHKITARRGGFDRVLDDSDRFGSSLANVGDLDGDGIAELAVGLPGDDDGKSNPEADVGAVWFLFLGSDASVRYSVKASATQGGFPAPQPNRGELGLALGAVAERAVGIGTRSNPPRNWENGIVWRTLLAESGAAVCGDGSVAGLEECDDGGTDAGDGCTESCRTQAGFTCSGSPSVCVFTCGDGVVDAGDECDDGNIIDGDGCDAVCRVERNRFCSGEPSTCSEGTTTTSSSTTTSTMPPAVCGDGYVQRNGETCDDGNLEPGDGCDEQCQIETGWACTGNSSICTLTCGDGVIDCHDECDDGNLQAGDGCAANCAIEPNYSCTRQPSVCSLCGDGLIGPSERCDDGNLEAGDGCDVGCQTEDGWICAEVPSQCVRVCGDGTLAPGEECDDGNTLDGDGCTRRCVIEAGFDCTGEPSVCGPAMSTTTTTTTLPRACGDGNGDGAVTSSDAYLALRTGVGIDDACPAAFCDVNADGHITAVDAFGILREAVGLSIALVCPA